MSLDTGISDVVSAIGTKIKTKQDVLVSGTNIKTINGTSLLGPGNITISGGSGGTGGTQNVFIQETEPVIETGEKALWLQTSADGSVMFNLVTGD
jgi:glutamate synthase domain-containing protein 2